MNPQLRQTKLKRGDILDLFIQYPKVNLIEHPKTMRKKYLIREIKDFNYVEWLSQKMI